MPKMIEGLRETLVAELAKMISDEGSEITIRALARRAGVAVGTIYNYFPDKDDLLKALFQKEWSGTFGRLEQELSGLNTVEEKVCSLVSVLYEDSEKVAGSMFRRKELMRRRTAPGNSGTPYPFRAEALHWLCSTSEPLWREYFPGKPQMEKVLVLIVSTVPRLIQLFPQEREANIRLIRSLVAGALEGATDEQG
jgi:AcrR family transcriptional regulator